MGGRSGGGGRVVGGWEVLTLVTRSGDGGWRWLDDREVGGWTEATVMAWSRAEAVVWR